MFSSVTSQVPVNRIFPMRWEDLPQDEQGPRTELVDGSLLVTPSGDLRHQYLIARLTIGLVELAPAGWVALPGANVLRRAATDRLLIPDVLVVAADVVTAGAVHVEPSDVLLVAEIESPSTRCVDRVLKRELYAQWQVPDYWIIDPEKARMTRLQLGADRQYAEGRGSEPWLAACDDATLWVGPPTR